MATISSTEQSQYERLAEQLALMPETVARLLVDHAADDTGRCVGCTRPGTGYPARVHPCTLHRLALMALAVRRRMGER
ncbi:hypothetical protein [Pseudonocardia sp. MH-G8]|uniref:hypothetical protein n=1 Tax=Pseudonocardia sp. MH-G8 TaxID=1854588 RepID=UPI000BA0C688|nr:hypothetical protein [Pseudonocardia sp. MH-G8]OZM81204.1 hypothetical protein CFP66_17690 [Pseudonocardia sp. MH-G8]